MARIAINLNPLNPVALREMRARMRGPRSFLLLGIYLSLLALLLYTVYVRSGGGSTYTYGGYTGNANFGPTKSFEVGQNLFISVFLFLIAFVSLVTPAITGGVVSREFEGRTYDLLVITPLRNRSVAFGKLFAALSFIFFMVISALPMACIVFVFGGVTAENILVGFGVVFLAAITFGITGLFFSALVKRTGVAVMLTYTVVAILLIGTWLVSNNIVSTLNAEASRQPGGVQRIHPQLDPNYDLPKRILVANPVAALGSILARNAPYRGGSSEDLQLFPNSKLFGGNPNTYFANSSANPGLTAAVRSPVFSGSLTLWQGYFLVYTGISLTFYLLSLIIIKPGLGARFSGFSKRKASTHTKLPKEKKKKPTPPPVPAPVLPVDETLEA